MFARLSRFGALVLVAALIGCSTTVTRPVIPTLSYSHLPPLELSVARVDLVEAYRSPLQDPNVEHTFPTPPALAFKRWVSDRLRPVGQDGSLRVTIEDASARRAPLPRTEGVEALFTTDQVERIDATVNVLLETLDNGGNVTSTVTARAQRTRTIPEGLTLNERDQIYQEITEALINDLNTTLEQNIRQYMARYMAS
ncbi:MAG: hypothetical protein AB7P52_05985 [Alphaproteobacteria bacterium]